MYRYAAWHANEASGVLSEAGFCLCKLDLPRILPILPFEGATGLFSCGVLVHVLMHVPVPAARPSPKRENRRQQIPSNIQHGLFRVFRCVMTAHKFLRHVHGQSWMTPGAYSTPCLLRNFVVWSKPRRIEATAI